MKKFNLTLKYTTSTSVGPVSKIFNTSNTKRAWGFAKKWADNCLAICGKHPITQEAAHGWELEIVKDVR